MFFKSGKFLKIPSSDNKNESLINKKDNDSIWNFIFGLVGGAIGFAILSSISKPKCPNCKNKIERNIPECPHCHVKLGWK